MDNEQNFYREKVQKKVSLRSINIHYKYLYIILIYQYKTIDIKYYETKILLLHKSNVKSSFIEQ